MALPQKAQDTPDSGLVSETPLATPWPATEGSLFPGPG